MKKIFTLLSISLMALTLTAQNKLTKTADTYFAAKNYAIANYEYQKALHRQKKDLYTAVRIAYCYMMTGDLTEAENFLTEAEKLIKGPHPEFNYVKAEIAHFRYDFDLAIAEYEKAKDGSNNSEMDYKINQCKVGKELYAEPNKAELKNLSVINSAGHDFLPKITADHHLMYFTSSRSAADGEQKPEDIYIARYINDEWVQPEKLNPPLNTKDNEASVGLSPSGQQMFVFKGGENGGDLFISMLKGNEWTEPSPFPYNTEGRESSMSISHDGKTLMFVRSKIDQDAQIYQSKLQADGSWGKPELLSSAINSEYDEASPYLHPDGVTLYFSSKGHNSMGGYDIFKSELKDGQWQEPVNMGYPINTTGDDICFVLDAKGEFGFYSSSMEGGEGGQDLYMITMPQEEQDHKLVLMTGVITDAETKKPVKATIVIIDNQKNEVVAEFESNEVTGEYLVSLPGANNYGIRIDRPGSLFHSENVFLGEDAHFEAVEKDIELVPEKSGAKIVLHNIFFETGKADLDSASFAELDNLVKILSENKEIKIELSGHTDNVGSQEINQKLSQARADAVKAYIVDKGIDGERIHAVGYGSEKPVASNDTEKGRHDNRRTEMQIL